MTGETMTTIERMIMQAVGTRPQTWLNCAGQYIGEVLALQCKGLIELRTVGNQLQIRSK